MYAADSTQHLERKRLELIRIERDERSRQRTERLRGTAQRLCRLTDHPLQRSALQAMSDIQLRIVIDAANSLLFEIHGPAVIQETGTISGQLRSRRRGRQQS